MNIFLYDQSFEGLLTAIYESIELNILPDKIVSTKSFQDDLFAAKYDITTNSEKFEDMWNRVLEKSDEQNLQRIFKAFLSEVKDIELIIYNYIKLILNSTDNSDLNIRNDNSIKILNLQKKVSKEALKVIMIVRFQETVNKLFYTTLEPNYNVLPLTIKHFRSRFADKKWVIFDTKRKYGYYYDLDKVSQITIGKQKIDNKTGIVKKEALHVSEKLLQKLWRGYYDMINVKERKNIKINSQFLTNQFWKFLPEKESNPKSIIIQ